MQTPLTAQEQTRIILHELGFPPHFSGYKMLSVAIPLYAQDDTQSLTKELYPAIAKQFGYFKPIAVEHPMRYAISFAWEHGDSEAWEQYFPKQEKSPSNRAFIAMLAEYLK